MAQLEQGNSFIADYLSQANNVSEKLLKEVKNEYNTALDFR
jgi:hypothetical protein